jgi:glycosyltransferase involved in cell wall biosynthesis
MFSSDLAGVLEESGVIQMVAVLRGPRSVEYPCPVEVLPEGRVTIPGINMNAGKLAALRARISSFRPDVLHAHGGDSLKYSVMAAGRGRIPVVYRRIGHAPTWITRGVQRVVHAQLMRRATVVVAVSHSVQRETVELFGLPEHQVLMIPRGIDSRRIRATRAAAVVRDDLAIEPGRSVVLSLGSLSWEKDPMVQIAVAGRLRDHPSRPVFLLSGEGPLRGELEAEIRSLGLEGTVRLLGARSDVGDLLAASDALLFTSRSDGMEGMPGVLIEAGLAGVPVAAYRVAGAAEVIGDGATGFLVEPGDADGLVAALATLLGDRASSAAMGAAARTACEPFEIRAVAPRYLDLYARLTDPAEAAGPDARARRTPVGNES